MLPNEATTVPHFPPLALIAKENKSGKSSGYCCTCHHHTIQSKTRAVRRFSTQNATSSSSERQGRCTGAEIGAQLAACAGRRIADRDPSCAAANGGAGAGGARRARSTASAGQTAARTAPTVRGLQDSLGGGAYKTSIRIRRRGQVRWWSATARASRAQSRTRGRGAAHVPPPRRRDGTGRGACTWRR